MLERAPGTGSVSGLVNELLRDFADRMEPVLDAGLAGDSKAALALLQATTFRDFTAVAREMSQMTEDIHNKSAAGGAAKEDPVTVA
jgi:hypothetical protein